MAIDFEDTPADEYCARTLPAVIKSASITISAMVKLESTPGGGSYYTVVFAEPRNTAPVNQKGAMLGVSSLGPRTPFGLIGIGGAQRTVYDASVQLSIGTWYRIAMTFDDSSKDFKLFVDGVEKASNPRPGESIDWTDGTGYPNPAQLYFGATKSNALGGGATVPDIRFFDGVIDDVQIFDAALDADAQKSMLHRRQPWHANLTGYWRLDDVSGATLADLKNGNDATLYNAARVGGGPLTYG